MIFNFELMLKVYSWICMTISSPRVHYTDCLVFKRASRNFSLRLSLRVEYIFPFPTIHPATLGDKFYF